jgi:hypothetical protein
MIYFATWLVPRAVWCEMMVNDELERIWKQVDCLIKVLFKHVPGGTEDNYKLCFRKAGVPVEILTDI